MKREWDGWQKVLVDGESCNGGQLTWSMPRKEGRRWIPGDWHEIHGDLLMCERGIHVTKHPYSWYKWGCARYACEVRDVVMVEDNKALVRSCRLLRPLPHPQWWRDAQAFVTSLQEIPWFRPDGKPCKSWRLYEASTMRAAWAAAWAAAGDAARAAAWAAAWAAAGDAARAAARDAAWAAAGDAAWAAARDAAGDAAGDAAWAAARDAALAAIMIVCADLPLAAKHQRHMEARWDVWRKGYCLLRDVNGVLYVYAVKADAEKNT